MKEDPSDWLLIADGEEIPYKKLQLLAQNKKILVLDGAYQFVKKSGLKIDVLLGDLDTIDPVDLAKARQNTLVIEAPDQNKTDLQKGIEYLDSLHAKSICITAATGKRLQHTVFNLRILKKYHRENRPLIMISGIEVIRYFQDKEITITGKGGDSIGLLGFPEAIITTSGLKYDVVNYAMQFEKHSSICNALVKEQAQIKIQGGILVIHENSDLP